MKPGKYTGYQFKSGFSIAKVGDYDPDTDEYEMYYAHDGVNWSAGNSTRWTTNDIKMLATAGYQSDMAWKFHCYDDPIDKMIEELYPTSSSSKS